MKSVHGNSQDITGKKFGKLTAVRDAGSSKRYSRLWECLCDCGGSRVVPLNILKRPFNHSCGCLHHSLNGLYEHPLYCVWANIKSRCYDRNNKSFKNYGGRGVTMCESWQKSFLSFYEDVNSGYNQGLQIDRIDNSGIYSKENCRWVTSKINNNNRRGNAILTFNGKTQTISQWGDEIGIAPATIFARIYKGWPIEECLDKRKHFK